MAYHPDVRPDDLAFTLAHGRTEFAVRAALRAGSVADLRQQLAALADGAPPALDPAAAAWVAGGRLDLAAIGDCSHAMRVPLPGHPLFRERHWVDARPAPPAGSAGPAGPARPADDGAALADRVRDVLARTLDAPDLGPDDDFYDLGLDSMRAVEVVTLLRDTTGLPLAFEEFDGLRTLSELTDHLRAKLTPVTAAPVAAPAARTTSVDGHRHLLTRIRAGSAPGNVFFLPPAGGTTAAYIDLSRHLSDPRTLWALSHPTGQADGAGTIRELARLYTGLVRDQQPTGPYVLAGYSFGGSVAFEMAAELERDGHAVERVVMLDSHPPEAYLGGSADTRAFLAAFPVLVGEILPGARRSGPTGPASLEEIVESLGDASWSAAMKAELVRFFHVWQANHEALKRWLPDRPLAADIVVLTAQEQENQDIMSLLDIRPTERKLWAQHTSGQVVVLPVPGDHYSMLRSPENLPHLGRAVDQALRLPTT